MTNLVGRQLGQYEIVAVLGVGGMASVYRARQTSVARDVAIKVIRADLASQGDFVQRFQREAKTVASLDHPHILKVFDYGKQDDLLYLVMEIKTGGSLGDLIERGPLSTPDVERMLQQIAQALDYAHKRSIVHRDLKPHNVLLDEQGNAILTDFGIAKLLADGGKMTQTGATMGTPTYMSPEQWTTRPVDSRADIYSLGIMLYEMLSGFPPYKAETASQYMYMHLLEPPPSVRKHRAELPAEIEALINKAIAKEPDDRYQTATALYQAFHTVTGGPTTHSSALDPSATIKLSSPTTSDTSQKGMNNTNPSASTRRYNPADGEMGQVVQQAEAVTKPKSPPIIIAGIVGVVVVIVGLVVALASKGGGNVTPTAVTAITNGTAEGTPVTGISTNPPGDSTIPDLNHTHTDAKGVAQVGVPKGCFKMGSDPKSDDNADVNEQPMHDVCIAKAFWIDTTEVTNAAFQKFVDDGGYKKKEYWTDEGWTWLQTSGFTGPEARNESTDPNQPRVGINWYEASAYALWRGGRLPTEAEWEYTARGQKGSIYPWGNNYQNGQAQINETRSSGKVPKATILVKSFQTDKSWIGAYDLVGNVSEWAADWYDEKYYTQMVKDDPTGPASGSKRVIRGGSWKDSPSLSRPAVRASADPTKRASDVGVRVVIPG